MTVARPCGSVDGGHVVVRLVQRDVDQVLGAVAKEPAVHFDVVGLQVGLGAQFRDDGAVDGDSAFANDLLRLAAGGDAGLRENLLQTLFGHQLSLACGSGWRFRFRLRFSGSPARSARFGGHGGRAASISPSDTPCGGSLRTP